ncbi:unnamed protein product [Pleuronectes platessa]|uniref:Uncharacterized protein n=1 Tax=Pleuronectes platessa TaxID=8262 RepID=A0A9N7Z9H3_PLEPL|nr:unnamed protein product [Pleuronectes platessa]
MGSHCEAHMCVDSSIHPGRRAGRRTWVVREEEDEQGKPTEARADIYRCVAESGRVRPSRPSRCLPGRPRPLRASGAEHDGTEEEEEEEEEEMKRRRVTAQTAPASEAHRHRVTIFLALVAQSSPPRPSSSSSSSSSFSSSSSSSIAHYGLCSLAGVDSQREPECERTETIGHR